MQQNRGWTLHRNNRLVWTERRQERWGQQKVQTCTGCYREFSELRPIGNIPVCVFIRSTRTDMHSNRTVVVYASIPRKLHQSLFCAVDVNAGIVFCRYLRLTQRNKVFLNIRYGIVDAYQSLGGIGCQWIRHRHLSRILQIHSLCNASGHLNIGRFSRDICSARSTNADRFSIVTKIHRHLIQNVNPMQGIQSISGLGFTDWNVSFACNGIIAIRKER